MKEYMFMYKTYILARKKRDVKNILHFKFGGP